MAKAYVDAKEIQKLASLSKLKISENDLSNYAGPINEFIEYFEKLEKTNTDGILPLVTPTPLELYMREDKVEVLTTVDEILQNAPERTGNLFRVPPVVSNES